MCHNTIENHACGHSEHKRQECEGVGPAAYRCKASNLPTYIINNPKQPICSACIAEFDLQDYQTYMAELTEIESEISKIEADHKEEDALHVATLTELLNWKHDDPREKVNEECRRHRAENLALAKLLSYWTIYLRVAGDKRKREMGTATDAEMESLVKGLEELRNLET